MRWFVVESQVKQFVADPEHVKHFGLQLAQLAETPSSYLPVAAQTHELPDKLRSPKQVEQAVALELVHAVQPKWQATHIALVPSSYKD